MVWGDVINSTQFDLLLAPPGCSSMKSVRSQTLECTATQQSSLVLCFPSSALDICKSLVCSMLWWSGSLTA